MKRLIVTADDFGAAVVVNEAVEAAHRGGVLTSASLMVAAPGREDAVARAGRMPNLHVGLHLVLVDGHPMSPPSALPDLTTKAGVFRDDIGAMGAEIFFRPSVRRQVETEIEAQFEAFRRTGLTLDHVNAHKHYHLHPTIAALVVKIGRRYGLAASRAPVEPHNVLAAVERQTLSPAYLTEPWARLLRARFRRSGVKIADQVFGLAWSGAMTRQRLAGLIRHLPDGLSEIYMHPASNGRFEGAAPGYRYAEELAALTAPETRQALEDSAAELGTFTGFA